MEAYNLKEVSRLIWFLAKVKSYPNAMTIMSATKLSANSDRFTSNSSTRVVSAVNLFSISPIGLESSHWSGIRRIVEVIWRNKTLVARIVPEKTCKLNKNFKMMASNELKR